MGLGCRLRELARRVGGAGIVAGGDRAGDVRAGRADRRDHLVERAQRRLTAADHRGHDAGVDLLDGQSGRDLDGGLLDRVELVVEHDDVGPLA